MRNLISVLRSRRHMFFFIIILVLFLFTSSGCSGVPDYQQDPWTPERVYNDPSSLPWYARFLPVPFFIKVLDYAKDYLGLYAWAFLMVPAAVRILLAPLVWKKDLALVKMKKLYPEIRRLREKYKSDPLRAHGAIRDLYTMHGTSQFASMGCLPMLLQTPIFVSLYQATLHYTPLRGEGFFIWDDIGQKDPYYLAPSLAAAMMFLWQVVNFMTQGKQQLNMGQVNIPPQLLLIMGPLITFAFFVSFPVASSLYLFSSNTIALLQSSAFYLFYVRPRRLAGGSEPQAKKASPKKKGKVVIEAEARVKDATGESISPNDSYEGSTQKKSTGKGKKKRKKKKKQGR
ncbi:membrane protein insertase YidC [Pasteuria penetrans]|uniref:membrane protein insertase YidC n=1 Tax=Pasteuria penetrans TaxID=86005 RepID=UPI000FB664C3|nr:membrane protein insertase YidC [Pasteuria penetrans]